MAEGMAALGASAEDIEAWRERQTGASVFEVWPENWDAVRLFLAAATQWRVAGMSGLPIGLDYTAVAAVAGVIGIEFTAPLLDRLQVIESAALDTLHRRRKQ